MSPDEIKSAVETMQTFEINGMRPFDTTPFDLEQRSLEQAHALATMLAAAFRDSDATRDTNCEIIGAAIEGIAHLIAVAAFVGEVQ